MPLYFPTIRLLVGLLISPLLIQLPGRFRNFPAISAKDSSLRQYANHPFSLTDNKNLSINQLYAGHILLNGFWTRCPRTKVKNRLTLLASTASRHYDRTDRRCRTFGVEIGPTLTRSTPFLNTLIISYLISQSTTTPLAVTLLLVYCVQITDFLIVREFSLSILKRYETLNQI